MLARVRSNIGLLDLARSVRGGPQHASAKLESAFAERFAFPYAVLFASGRSALRALCECLEWRDQQVLCPAYICAEVPYAVSLSGNRVSFVDSAPGHFLPGADEWRGAAGPSSAMAILTPLFGYPIDRNCVAAVRSVAPRAFVLFDEAQSYGVTDAAGLQAAEADGMLLSLGLGKMTTATAGGVLLLRDADIHRRLRNWRDRNATASSPMRTLRQVATGAAAWLAFREPALSIIDVLGRSTGAGRTAPEDWLPSALPQKASHASRMLSPLEARLGLLQFAKLSDFLAARRQIGSHYDQRLRKQGFRTFAHAGTPHWTRYPFPVSQRSTVAAALRADGIQTSFFLPYSCADIPFYRKDARNCPNAAVWARSMINLPNWYGMTTDSADRVVDSLLRLREREPEALEWSARGLCKEW